MNEGGDVRQSESRKAEVTGTADGTADAVVDPELLQAGLRKIRRRRWMLWSVIIVYLPTMWTTQRITGSFRDSLPVFFAWFFILLVATWVSAVARCPRCGNYFHLHGTTLLYLRKCLHCQLSLKGNG